ncbi:MAG: Crp/Fnr family transcriptional regulator [Bacteroidales bacterium]
MPDSPCLLCSLKSKAAGKLNPAELEVMGTHCSQVEFEADDIIFKQNSLSSNVVYVKTGLVKVHMMGPSREKILRIAKAPMYLCLPSNFGDKVNHFSATALEKTSVCFIDARVFQQLVHSNGDFAYQLILDLSRIELMQFISCTNQAQKQVNGRCADALLFFAKDIYRSNSFNLPVSRNELADYIGTSRENMSRILAEFHTAGIIEIDSRRITILKEDLLRQISAKG